MSVLKDEWKMLTLVLMLRLNLSLDLYKQKTHGTCTRTYTYLWKYEEVGFIVYRLLSRWENIMFTLGAAMTEYVKRNNALLFWSLDTFFYLFKFLTFNLITTVVDTGVQGWSCKERPKLYLWRKKLLNSNQTLFRRTITVLATNETSRHWWRWCAFTAS